MFTRAGICSTTDMRPLLALGTLGSSCTWPWSSIRRRRAVVAPRLLSHQGGASHFKQKVQDGINSPPGLSHGGTVFRSVPLLLPSLCFDKFLASQAEID